jgi:hypothetical protein
MEPAPAPMAHIAGEIDHTGKVWAPAQPAPGRNHYEDGDVFERIAAMNKPPAQPAPTVQPVAFEVGLVEWVGNKLMATPKVTTTPPASWMEMVTANLVREGVNKHKARELAEHFYGLAQPSPCTWTQSPDPNMPDTYEATCGAVWTFTEGGPADNDMHFCPKCGSKVVEGGAP